MVAAFLGLVGLCTAGIWRHGYFQALDQIEKQGRADLLLASDRFIGQLRRYRELAVFMAGHPALKRLSDDQGVAQAERLMRAAADRTGAFAMQYSDPQGRLLARVGDLRAPLDQSAAVRRARYGALGSGHIVYRPPEAPGARGDARRLYLLAAPAFDGAGGIAGVLTVLVDLAELEWDWIGGRPAVFFTTETGQVFLSNRSELLFWDYDPDGAGLRPADATEAAFRSISRGGHEIWQVEWGSYLPEMALHLTQPVPVIGMTGHALPELAPARRLAFLQASVFALICLIFGGVLLLAGERRRALTRANAQLEARVGARTAELSRTNAVLRREVSERQEAEAALKRTQAELVQAGKLSALGQMSAGISHELNQPLMAIRQFAENGAAFLQRGKSDVAGENLTRISQLADRAARIIRNLRAFARNENEPMGKVDLVRVIDSAVELTGARLRKEGIALDWHPQDHPAPVYAWGGEVRLAQVFVNLITNAADAMAASETRQIRITIDTGAALRVTLRDTGPGIADPDRIFEPFYSTKEVGSAEGLGLGLSISYGLVQSFGGHIRGANLPGGGAVFTVELEPWHKERAA